MFTTEQGREVSFAPAQELNNSARTGANVSRLKSFLLGVAALAASFGATSSVEAASSSVSDVVTAAAAAPESAGVRPSIGDLDVGSRFKVNIGRPTAPSDLGEATNAVSQDVVTVGNITAVNRSTAGFYVSVNPKSGTETSNVNTTADSVAANAVFMKNKDGTASLDVRGIPGASGRIIVDKAGNFTGLPEGALNTFDSPRRLLDRSGIQPGEVVKIPLGTEHANTIAFLNLTTANADAASYTSAYACNEGYKGTSNLNADKGDTKAVLVAAEVDSEGNVCLLQSLAGTRLVVDLQGFADFKTSAFKRIKDSRIDGSKLAPGQTVNLQVAPRGKNSLVMMNITLAKTKNSTHLSVGEAGTQPTTSSVNKRGDKTANSNFVMVNAKDGMVSIAAGPGGANYVVDTSVVEGFYDIDGTVQLPDGRVVAAVSANPASFYKNDQSRRFDSDVNDPNSTNGGGSGPYKYKEPKDRENIPYSQLDTYSEAAEFCKYNLPLSIQGMPGFPGIEAIVNSSAWRVDGLADDLNYNGVIDVVPDSYQYVELKCAVVEESSNKDRAVVYWTRKDDIEFF